MDIKKFTAFILSCTLTLSSLSSHYIFAMNDNESLLNMAKTFDTDTKKSKVIQIELDNTSIDLLSNNFKSIQAEVEIENSLLRGKLNELKKLVNEINAGKIENAQKKQKLEELARQIQDLQLQDAQKKNVEKNDNDTQKVSVLSKTKNFIKFILISSAMAATSCFLFTLSYRAFGLIFNLLDLLLKPFFDKK